jgi:predicted O-linked N-acetylglucosamine transferase (SPINDLY family)
VNHSARAGRNGSLRIIARVLGDLLSRAARLLTGGSTRAVDEVAARARALAMRGAFEAAASELEVALGIEPRSAALWGRLADLRFELGLVDAAISAYRQALELDPRTRRIRSNLLFALAHRVDDPESLLDDHLAWAEIATEHPTARARDFHNDRDPERALRVGYVSADFKGHAVSLFIEPLLARHDPARVVVHCYDNAPSTDDVAQRLRSYGAVWREVKGLDGDGFRRQVLADGIDLLIDLSGHTAGNRLPDLARRVAPVQATYLGYHGTTGLGAMDYRVTDPYADPPGETERHYVEQLARMPHCLWCYRPASHEPGREAVERRDERPTFASLNNLRKISAPALAAWARILLAVPEARLVIAGAAEGPALRDVLAQLARNGVNQERVECIRWLAPAEFAALHGRIDLALDAYPFNGGTTTIEALARGVPVVSWAGRTAASRCGRTILSNVGLPELVADSAEGYVAAAVSLGRDRARQSALRADLPGRVRRSPLMDEARFVADLEQLYRRMWRHWCREQRQ